jgi:hypothetical protein
VLQLSSLSRICVVCIAPTHPALADDTIEIESIAFQNESFDVSNNKVHGKRKSKYQSFLLMLLIPFYVMGLVTRYPFH